MKSSLPLLASVITASVFVSGCILGGGDKSGTGGNQLGPGVYHNYSGPPGSLPGLESELVLEADGGFRFFGIWDTTPRSITRGNWESHDGTLILKSAVRRYSHYTGVFDYWDSVRPDTSYLRRISSGTFERLEVSWDSDSYASVQWAQYVRLETAPLPADGLYQFAETYRDPDDSTLIHTWRMYLSLARNGLYHDSTSLDGRPQFQNEGRHWFQSGSFLVVRAGRGRDYDDSLGFSEWEGWLPDSNAEYVVRVRATTQDSFQQWMAEDQTYTGVPHWITWRRASLP